MHLHHFNFDTEGCSGHMHRISGYTESMLGVEKLHFHYYSGVTSYNSHSHYFAGFTGLPVKTANGHIHILEGHLDINHVHDHKYKAYTFEEVQYTGKRSRTALGNC